MRDRKKSYTGTLFVASAIYFALGIGLSPQPSFFPNSLSCFLEDIRELSLLIDIESGSSSGTSSKENICATRGKNSCCAFLGHFQSSRRVYTSPGHPPTGMHRRRSVIWPASGLFAPTGLL